MARLRSIIVLGVTLAVIVGFVALATAAWRAAEDPAPLAAELLASVDTPADTADTTPRLFVVRPGESTTAIAERLEAADLVRQALVFRLMAEFTGESAGLAAGEYEFSPSMRPSEILAMLAHARTRPSPMVTIPEGWRAEEVAERLAARGIGPADRFMEVVRHTQFSLPALASRPVGTGLEGYLFPDTYSYDSKTTADVMAERMVEQFEQRFTPDMRDRASRLGLTVHQAVTLASIIEREAVIPSERPLMAGVFYNRLKEGMPLQTDPTVQYAVATLSATSQRQYGWWKGVLTYEDLEIASPYNTYRYPGLPPGPICNPGLASLLAAVEPASTDYLYFVARPDGSHAFARTLEEHNENVARYR